MAEINENGRSNSHEAAYRGYLKSLEKFIEKFPEHLELETVDEVHQTPLLLACQGGHLECVQLLIDLGSISLTNRIFVVFTICENSGANVSVKDRLNRGCIETSALFVHLHILKYLAELNNPKITVWKNLLLLASS